MGSVPVPQSVAIVGGGNTAVDTARVLKRNGTRDVHVITHQALPAPGVAAEIAMTAIPREIAQAQEEGVVFHEFRGIHRLILRGEKVVGLELVHMKKVAQANGKLETKAFEGTETVLHVEQVIPAIGQEVLPFGVENLLENRPFFKDEWGALANTSIFVGGDARGGRHPLPRGRRRAARGKAIAAAFRAEPPLRCQRPQPDPPQLFRDTARIIPRFCRWSRQNFEKWKAD
jgi:NADPH-dependent glutamate synthase beta subunit-like oxidoreductase